MARKRTLEELRAIAEKKEKLFKKALKDVEEREAAEREKVRKDILAAIEEWRMAAPEEKRMAVEELPALKRLFAKFVTNDSDDEGFRQYTLEKSEYLFGNIQRYWGNLIDHTSQ